MRSDKERLAVLVHEVRSPVAALRAIAETTSREPGGEQPTRRRLVELAIAACHGIERLLDDVTVSSVRLEEVDSRPSGRGGGRNGAVLGGANVRAQVDAGPASDS